MQYLTCKSWTRGRSMRDLSIVQELNSSVLSLERVLTQSGRQLIGFLLRFRSFNITKFLKSLGKATSDRLHPARLKLTKEFGKETHGSCRTFFGLETQDRMNACHVAFCFLIEAASWLIGISLARNTVKDFTLHRSLGNSTRFEQPDIMRVLRTFSLQISLGSFSSLLQFLIFNKMSRAYKVPMDSWTSTRLTHSLRRSFSSIGSPEKSGVLTREREWLRLRNFTSRST